MSHLGKRQRVVLALLGKGCWVSLEAHESSGLLFQYIHFGPFGEAFVVAPKRVTRTVVAGLVRRGLAYPDPLPGTRRTRFRITDVGREILRDVFRHLVPDAPTHSE